MQITKPSWWVNMFVTTIVTMVFIYIIKKATEKINVPVLTEIAREV